MIIWRGWGALPIVIAALCIGLGGLMSTLNKGLFGVFAGLALIGGGGLRLAGRADLASLAWAAGVVPALLLLVVEIARQLRQAEPGVDIIAGLSMAGALALGETLAGVVIALMFTGGNVLEEHAQRRARRELTALLASSRPTASREPTPATCSWATPTPPTERPVRGR